MSPEEKGANTLKLDAEKPASTVVSARLEGFAMASKAFAGIVTCNPDHGLHEISLCREFTGIARMLVFQRRKVQLR